ncbi:hypothetical protein B0T19DRAFT_283748 [Cercophora scortea]|uniref:Uncharacterized protein n=1 Tax=Cercophora scortea TaxID=314031 RepID=A0AAE0M5N6_9PEZI|nr:hypothetical protein B0T19DRAFT_283748 [Cercophora scortea]
MDDPWDKDCSMVPNSMDSRYFGDDVDLVGSPEDAGINMTGGPTMSALQPPYLDTNYLFDWSPTSGYPASSQMGEVPDNLADEHASWMALDSHSPSQASLPYHDQSLAVFSTAWSPGHAAWSPSSPPVTATATATSTMTTTSSNQDDQPQELSNETSEVTDATTGITTNDHADPGTAMVSDPARSKSRPSRDKSGKQNRKRHTSPEGSEAAPSNYTTRGNGRGKGSGKGSGKSKRQATAKDHHTTSVATTHVDPVDTPTATIVKCERQPLSVELLEVCPSTSCSLRVSKPSLTRRTLTPRH